MPDLPDIHHSQSFVAERDSIVLQASVVYRGLTLTTAIEARPEDVKPQSPACIVAEIHAAMRDGLDAMAESLDRAAANEGSTIES